MRALEERVALTLSPPPERPRPQKIYLVVYRGISTCEIANEITSVLECAFASNDIRIIDITNPTAPLEYIGSDSWVAVDQFRVN